MNQPFNKLSPKQDELLTLLAEECAEVIQAVTKIQRHGLESHHPDSGIGNRINLMKEMGDVRAAMILVCGTGMAHKETVHDYAENKLNDVLEYLHHFDDEF